MTQPPLGTTPGGPGPFDEPGPGFPDVASSGTDATFDQYADRPVAEPLDTTHDQTSPYPATTSRSYGDATSTESDSTVDTAKGEAKQVAGTALDSGKDVAQTAKSEAANVAAEAKQQAASLFDTVRTEAGEQAGTQQQRIAEALHGLAKELGGMASSSRSPVRSPISPTRPPTRAARSRTGSQDREPADVVEAVRSYARRRPVTFLALCGFAGVLAGRLTRSTVATRTSLDSTDADDFGPLRSCRATARRDRWSSRVRRRTPPVCSAPRPRPPMHRCTATIRRDRAPATPEPPVPVTELNGDLTR